VNISATPIRAVAILRVHRVVATIDSGEVLLSEINIETTDDDIADKKIKPAACHTKHEFHK